MLDRKNLARKPTPPEQKINIGKKKNNTAAPTAVVTLFRCHQTPPPLHPPAPPAPPPVRQLTRSPPIAVMMEDHQEEGASSSSLSLSSSLSHMRQSSLVKEIMGKVVATKSALNYAYQNASFALFCYESEVLRDLLLEPWFILRLTELTMPTAKKKYVQECLLICSGEDNNCPFILSNFIFPHLVTSYRPKPGREAKQKDLLWGRIIRSGKERARSSL